MKKQLLRISLFLSVIISSITLAQETQKYYFNFGRDIADFYQNYVLISHYMYPDSNAKIYRNGELDVPERYTYGMALDPSAIVWSDMFDQPFFGEEAFSQYTLDSVYLPYQYIRFENNPNPDTLLIEVFDQRGMTIKGFSQDDMFVNLGYDTEKNRVLREGGNIGKPIVSEKIILDESYETGLQNFIDGIEAENGVTYTEAFKNLGFKVDKKINKDEVVAVVYSFIPGYSTKPGDTLAIEEHDVNSKPLNAFFFREIFNQEEDDFSYDIMKLNNSLLITQDNRWQTPEGEFWHGYFCNRSFVNIHPYLDMTFAVTGPKSTTSVKEYDFDDSAYIYPNPSNNGETRLRIDEPTSKSLNMSILNITGKIIQSTNINVNAGVNHINIPTSNLTAGLYIIQLTGADYNKTIKFTIE